MRRFQSQTGSIEGEEMVNKICRRCGREFFVNAYHAPMPAFDRCGQDDCLEVWAAREGLTIIATSEDPPGTVRVTLADLKPECRLPVAQAFSDIFLSKLAHLRAEKERDSAKAAGAEPEPKVAAAA